MLGKLGELCRGEIMGPLLQGSAFLLKSQKLLLSQRWGFQANAGRSLSFSSWFGSWQSRVNFKGVQLSDEGKLEGGCGEQGGMKEFQELNWRKVDVLKQDKQEEFLTALRGRWCELACVFHGWQICSISVRWRGISRKKMSCFHVSEWVFCIRAGLMEARRQHLVPCS